MRLNILMLTLSFLLLSCASQDLTLPEAVSYQAPLPAVEKKPTDVPIVEPTPVVVEESQESLAEPTPTQPSSPPINPIPGTELFDFTGRGPGWYTVDDDVMGGVSSSQVTIIDEDLSFSGTMSLENNGGFSSVRSEWAPIDLSNFDGVLLRVLGDGKDYRFRIRSIETGPNVSYNAVFKTTPGEWEIYYLPFATMVPTYFGSEVDVGRIDKSKIGSFGFMLSDNQSGDFELLVDWIRVVSEEDLQIVSMN